MKFLSYAAGFLFASALTSPAFAQQNEEKGQFSGNLLLNYQKYVRDDKIGANTRVYRENTASTDAWLYMQYRIGEYNFTLRYDAFNNSPLLDPQDAFTDHGVGYWQIQKQGEKLGITVGSFYDQLGSGILFRAYEQRQIGLDYAMQGARLTYNLGENWRLKAFAGNQKGTLNKRFSYNPQVISGANIEGFIPLGENSRRGSLTVGASALNRTLDKATMNKLVSIIETYQRDDQFYPKYNVWGFNSYATWSKGNFSLNAEGNWKSPEAIIDFDGKLKLKQGKVYYTSISWGKSGISWRSETNKDGSAKTAKEIKAQKASVGLNIQARHVDHFPMRTDPTATLLNGLVSYLPSMTRQNTYRLLARYNAPAQDLGENGIQGEFQINPQKGTYILLNGSYVMSLASNGTGGTPEHLFREYYGECQQNIGKNHKVKLGVQSIYYNQARYEQELEYEPVKTLTPFAEWLYKAPGGRSMRVEAQYLKTDRDQGSFANAMVEYYWSKHFSMAVGDMVNIEPHRYERMIIADEVLHYPTFFLSYIDGPTWYTLSFLKQQQGVNCSGGVCREEPAFSGVRFTVNSTF